MPVAKGQAGVRQEMHKFKEGDLHSGSKSGPVVKSRKQAIAISLSEAGMARKKNPGSQANKDPRGAHGGFPTTQVGQARSRPAPTGAAPAGRTPPRAGARGNSSPAPRKLVAGGAPQTAMYGGPPAAGFSPVSPPAGTAVPSQHKKYEHLGRFATGKPRAGVGRTTAQPPIANVC